MQATLLIMLLLAAGVVITIYKGINIVPQGEEWVVERLGKFSRTLKPGLNIIIPYLDAIREKVSTRDIILDIPSTGGHYQRQCCYSDQRGHFYNVSQVPKMLFMVLKTFILQFSNL